MSARALSEGTESRGRHTGTARERSLRLFWRDVAAMSLCAVAAGCGGNSGGTSEHSTAPNTAGATGSSMGGRGGVSGNTATGAAKTIGGAGAGVGAGAGAGGVSTSNAVALPSTGGVAASANTTTQSAVGGVTSTGIAASGSAGTANHAGGTSDNIAGAGRGNAGAPSTAPNCQNQKCPSGYQCNALGACAGGDPLQIALDEQAISVSGILTVNGKAVACSGTSAIGILSLLDTVKGQSLQLAVVCTNGTAPATVSGTIVPGTYRVTVSHASSGTSLVAGGVLAEALVLTRDENSLALDEKLISIAGGVTLNGQPIACSGGSDLGTLGFLETGSGVLTKIPIVCSAGAASVSFSGSIVPGSYRITIDKVAAAGHGLLAGALLADKLSLTDDSPSLVLDEKSLSVGGTVTVNDRAVACSGTSEVGVIRFTDVSSSKQFRLPLQCANGTVAATFSGSVPPGTYRVGVDSVSVAGTQLLVGAVLADQLSLSQSDGALAFDQKTIAIGGTLTVDGGGVGCNGGIDVFGYLVFTETARGDKFSIAFPCSAPSVFSGAITPGTYRVAVGNLNVDALPGTEPRLFSGYTFAEALSLTQDNQSLAFNQRTIAVGGTLTLNGKAIACSGTGYLGVLGFRETDIVDRFQVPLSCANGTAAATFAGVVVPGSYQITIANLTAGGTQLVSGAAIGDAVVLTQDNKALAFDQKTTAVGGSLTLNGRPIACSGNASLGDLGFTEITSGVTLDLSFSCANGSSGVTFSGALPPGTYRVSVRNLTVSGTGLANGVVLVERLTVP